MFQNNDFYNIFGVKCEVEVVCNTPCQRRLKSARRYFVSFVCEIVNMDTLIRIFREYGTSIFLHMFVNAYGTYSCSVHIYNATWSSTNLNSQ